MGGVTIGHTGPDVDGHLHFLAVWHRADGKGEAMRCAYELKAIKEGGFITDLVIAKSLVSWKNIEVTTWVTCGKHPLSGYKLTDANPSNDHQFRDEIPAAASPSEGE